MKIKTEEANGIIAEYMFGKHYTKGVPSNHFLSLDSLVPVWDKLKVTDAYFTLTSGHCPWFFEIEQINNEPVTDFEGWEKTIEEAACIAAAKAILKLNEK